MFTKEQLIKIGVENLADIILSLYQNIPDIQTELEIIVAGFDSDPAEGVAMVKRKIASLRRSSDFIDYYESDSFAKRIDQIRIHIMKILPKSPTQATELLLELLDCHETTLERMDDSNGTVGDVFEQVCADLGKAYEHVTNPVEEIVKLVYVRFMNNGYSVYDNIISYFKKSLGEEGLKQLKLKLEKSFNKKKSLAIQTGLKSIADCQNNVDAYIQACSITEKLSTRDYLEIARRLIKHGRGKEAIKWLDSMEPPEIRSWLEEKMDLKVQALVLCGDYSEAQTERQKWFDTSLNPKVYNEILKHSEAGIVESWKSTAVQKALDFPDSHVALNFFTEIQDFEQAAKLIHLKSDTLNGNNYHTLRPIADLLCKTDPLAATLLYRKMIEPPLSGTKSKYYQYPAKDLALCRSLSSKVTDWKGHKTHQVYFEEFSAQHKRKTNFWREYTSALNIQMAKDAIVANDSEEL